jgi:signal transduction histidine kinase
MESPCATGPSDERHNQTLSKWIEDVEDKGKRDVLKVILITAFSNRLIFVLAWDWLIGANGTIGRTALLSAMAGEALLYSKVSTWPPGLLFFGFNAITTLSFPVLAYMSWKACSAAPMGAVVGAHALMVAFDPSSFLATVALPFCSMFLFLVLVFTGDSPEYIPLSQLRIGTAVNASVSFTFILMNFWNSLKAYHVRLRFKQEVERMDLQKTRFIRSQAHDLRSPLACITGLLSLALNGNESDFQKRQFLKGALASAEELSSVSFQLVL